MNLKIPTKKSGIAACSMQHLVASSVPRRFEYVDGHRHLGHQGHDVPLPQLVVLDTVRDHWVLAAEVGKEDRCP